MCSKDLVAQARFVPATLNAAQIAAAVGPAVTMMMVQVQLDEVSNLAPAATTTPGHDGFACGEAVKAFFEFHLFSKVTSKSIKRFSD